MKVGSLFSGGGLGDLGFLMAGCEIVFQVEIDEYCQKILALRYPDAVKFRDIRTVKGADLPSIDILIGGFPCQDLSYAGKGAGIEGERSGLWKEYSRLICEILQKYIVVENVPALLSRGMGVVLGDLASCGYDAEWDCIPASAFGAPHERDRAWIVAYSNKLRLERTWPQQQTERDTGDTEDKTAYDWSQRREGVFKGQIPRVKEFSWCEDVRRVEDLRNRPDIPEPLICRASDGYTNRMERLRLIGNGQVSFVTKWIAERIIEFNTYKKSDV